MKIAREEFELALAEELETRLGDDSDRYGITQLVTTVVDVMDLENTDRGCWSILTDRLVKILKGERNRIDRIESWNRRNQSQTQ